MCLILVGINARPGSRVLLLANRDEFRARASAAVAPWAEDAEVLGGRDLVAGGSWLAVRGSGRFAAVTNVRNGPPRPAPRSRGDLVRDYVLGDTNAEAWLAALQPEVEQFAPFNLILGDGGRVLAFDGSTRQVHVLEPGLHAISNGPLDQPWPKMRRVRILAQAALAAQAASNACLLDVLHDRRAAPDAQLPDTGFGLERERALSPIFIAETDYGTRASTLLELKDTGVIELVEQRFGTAGHPIGQDHWRHASRVQGWRSVRVDTAPKDNCPS